MSLESRLQRLEHHAYQSHAEPFEIVIRFVSPDGKAHTVLDPRTAEPRDIRTDGEKAAIHIDLARGLPFKEDT